MVGETAETEDRTQGVIFDENDRGEVVKDLDLSLLKRLLAGEKIRVRDIVLDYYRITGDTLDDNDPLIHMNLVVCEIFLQAYLAQFHRIVRVLREEVDKQVERVGAFSAEEISELENIGDVVSRQVEEQAERLKTELHMTMGAAFARIVEITKKAVEDVKASREAETAAMRYMRYCVWGLFGLGFLNLAVLIFILMTTPTL